MIELGPITAMLESELRTETRRQGIVVWLDADHHYSDFVDRLIEQRKAGELPYDVCAYRGSFLELMLTLENVAAGIDPPPLLLHMPGFNHETIETTPVLELYRAGRRYQKVLTTLVRDAATGRVRAEQLEAFLASGMPTLDQADRWISSLLSGDQSEFGQRLRDLSLTTLIDDLLGGGFVATHATSPRDQEALRERLTILTGWDSARRLTRETSHQPAPLQLASEVARWALCVEFVHDMKREPIVEYLQAAKPLSTPLITECQQLAAHLRSQKPDLYRRIAEETEDALQIEMEACRAENLGRIDTFRFEETLFLEGALSALRDSQWQLARDWAEQRRENSFWLREDAPRRATWQLIGDAARLGLAIQAATMSLDDCRSLAEIVDRYVELGAAVDQAHRLLEQRRLALLYPQLPEFESLRQRLDELRVLWREWADAWSRRFNEVCQSEGFLPDTSLQQRTLFDSFVRPLCQESGITALVLVDAFRYEMAEELQRSLSDAGGTTIRLQAALAELPTITAIGMNALAPVCDQGRLTPAITDGKVLGLAASELRVFDPDTRRRVIHQRIGGSTCPWLTLTEVLSREAASLQKSIARAKLVVVHCSEIDDAGEKGVGLSVFDQTLQQLRAACRLLRDAGVRRFLITADHGFLLLDETTRTLQSHGRKIDPHRRHVFSSVAAQHTDEVCVPLRSLGYDGDAANQFLMLPKTTAVFDTGAKSQSFVHGGNSLQERVIPVLSVLHQRPSGSRSLEYKLQVSAEQGVAGMHCLKARADLSGLGLTYSSAEELELALRVADADEVLVELCETRGGARLSSGTIVAQVGESFELFFRLSGTTDDRVQVELYHPASDAEVVPVALDTRFAVTAARKAASEVRPTRQPTARFEWLQSLPDGGVQQIFEHLAQYGTVTESEAANMLGGPRELRRFTRQFEEYATKIPFLVRIDNVSGVKRYVKEGT